MKKTSRLVMALVCATAIMQISCKSSVKTERNDQTAQTPFVNDNSLINTDSVGNTSIPAINNSDAYGNIPDECLTYFNQQRGLYAANLGTFEQSLTYGGGLEYCRTHVNTYMQGPLWDGYQGDLGYDAPGVVAPIQLGVGIGGGTSYPTIPVQPTYQGHSTGGCSNGSCGVNSGYNSYPSTHGSSCHNGSCGVSSCTSGYCSPGVVGAAANLVRGTLNATSGLLFGRCGSNSCY